MIRKFFSALAALSCLAIPVQAATIDFELPTFPLATMYGPPVHVPGSFAFAKDQITATIEQFTEGAFVGFNFAEISGHPGPPVSFFPMAANPTQSLTINNVAFNFDFTGVPGDVTKVRFDYVDLGGTENIDINSIGRQELDVFSSVAPFPNFNINVTEILAGGLHGVVEIAADPGFTIQTLLIGGQELGIDNLMADSILNAASDFNNDGMVDLADFNILKTNFGKMDASMAEGDANNDGKVDLTDFNILKTEFGQSNSLVPEPSTLLLGCLAVLLLGIRRAWSYMHGIG